MANEQFVQKYRHIAFWLITGAVLIGCTAILLPFVPALLWATVLSVLMYPIFRRWEKRLEKSRFFGGDKAGTVASLITVVTTLLIILIPLLLIGVGLFAQIGGVSKTLTGEAGKPSFESTLDQVDNAIRPFVDKVAGDFSVKEYVLEHKEELTQSLRAPITRFAGQVGFTILTIVIAILSMFFMLRDGENLRQPAIDLIPLPPDKTNDILHRIGETIRAVFIGTVFVALVQGAIMGLAFVIAGVPNALMLAVATAVLGVIPLLGPPVLYIPVGLLLLGSGNVTGGVIVLVAGFAIASQIDNFLKPFLIGGRVNLHPLAIFFSILGGVLLIGPIGIMAGPMLLTILLALVEAIRTWMNENPPLSDEKAADSATA